MSRDLPHDQPARTRRPKRRRPRRTATRLVVPSLLTLALVATPAAVDPAQADGVVQLAGGIALADKDRTQGKKGAKQSAKRRPLRIDVLSNRADLLSGGDALVSVRLPKRVKPRAVMVRLNGRNVSKQFRRRADGSFTALLTGMRVGDNTLKARAVRKVRTQQGRTAGRKAGRRKTVYAGQRTLVNHPNGGPIFSGPQWVAYRCQETAQDAQCNEPARYELLYRSSNPTKSGLQPYDPAAPPRDVATTTTDQGVKVPFIVRAEHGYQDRDRYTIMTLFRPGKAWKPWKPQDQWNRKVLATHGGGCGIDYEPGSPRLEDNAGTIPALPGMESSAQVALGKGFAVLATALNNTGHNCNVSVEAESMMMAKERLVEQYGPIRYLIGTGCSGGSIAQHTIANAYPGIYQGLVTTCSYPDVLTAGAQFADYHLMRGYFEDPTSWAPGVAWLPTQVAAVEGHLTHLNAVVADEGLFKSAINPENACGGVAEPVAGDRSTRFDSETNPGGVRCSILDAMVSILDRRVESQWSQWEKAAGHGFAGFPFANDGVQYGLNQLKRGTITPAQFVDLNEKLGGLDVNSDPVPERIDGDAAALRGAYRSGLINEANHLDEVAMINHGGPDPGLAHDYAHAFWMHERLLADQGHTRNRVMWFGAVPMIGDTRWSVEAFLEMDRWLSAVERDRTARPLAEKIVAGRPGDLTDRCANVPGLELLPAPGGGMACQTPPAQLLQTRLSTPREQAGDDVRNDRVACQLKPLAREDYPALMTDAQFAQLGEIFPNGVCDYSRPGRGQGPAETWLTYGTSESNVAYGGRALPRAPERSGQGWMAPAFRELWAK